MCDTTAIMLGLSLATSAMGAVGQRQQTKAKFKASETQRRAQSEEIAASGGRKAGERAKQGRAERSRLRVAAGEAGVSGQSFEAQLMDSSFQEDTDIAAIGEDTGFAQRGSESRFQSALASVSNPNALTTALQIGSAGAQGYLSGLQIENARAVPSSPAPPESG